MKEIQHFILAALQAAGEPMTQDTLIISTLNTLKPRPLRSDVESAIKKLETGKYIDGLEDDIDGRKWFLTAKGQAKAKEQ